MILYLLRHGRSIANTHGLVTGSPEDTLTEEGRAQVERAASLVGSYQLHFTHSFVSGWKRAQETASLFLPKTFFQVDARLGETQAGDVAEMPLQAFNAAYPGFWAPFSPDRVYPGGESHQALYDRVVEWFEETTTALPDNASLLAVTHAGPISCLVQYVTRVSMNAFPMFIPENASLTKLYRDVDGHWRLHFFSLFAPDTAKVTQ